MPIWAITSVTGEDEVSLVHGAAFARKRVGRRARARRWSRGTRFVTGAVRRRRSLCFPYDYAESRILTNVSRPARCVTFGRYRTSLASASAFGKSPRRARWTSWWDHGIRCTRAAITEPADDHVRLRSPPTTTSSSTAAARSSSRRHRSSSCRPAAARTTTWAAWAAQFVGGVLLVEAGLSRQGRRSGIGRGMQNERVGGPLRLQRQQHRGVPTGRAAAAGAGAHPGHAGPRH